MAFLRPFSLLLVAFGLALVLAHTAAPQSEDDRPRVLAVEFDNDVNPVTADYLIGEIDRANEENYDAVVLLVDTPGGLDTAMRDIIKSELASEVPVILYVSPPGSRAASAGVFLAMAADVAAMAPGTNIGSSTPISSSGGDIPSDLRRKVINDAAAYIRELAESHGRNGDWAEDAVRKASNVGATEALELGIVDYVSPDLPTLLNEIDGTTTEPKGIVLNTADAQIDEVEMSFWKRLLDTLVDPNLIVLLMSIGLLGITIEVMNPGLIFPGTVGAICLIMGLFGLQVLPVSWAGVLLILLGFGFFVAEAFVISHGALALAGTVSFVIGALLLFDPAGSAYQVSVWVALAIGLHARAPHRDRDGEGHPGAADEAADRLRGARRGQRRRAPDARSRRVRLHPRRALEGTRRERPDRSRRDGQGGVDRRGTHARRLAGRGPRRGRGCVG